jgi:hypothetical protein
MVNEEEKPSTETTHTYGNYVLGLIVLGLIGVFIFSQFFEVNISPRSKTQEPATGQAVLSDISEIEATVLPSEGFVLAANWGNLGKQMVENGVIDGESFETLYSQRGGLTEEERMLVYGEDNGNLEINAENAGTVLNLLWAFGLSNKNPILEEGPMQDPRYGGPDRFASTGGWTLARGNVMDHYSTYEFVMLTSEQQSLVEEISKNIYRPCCGNSTYFPDCNHGMAMLGLLELMAAEGASEEEMYEAALQVNSYWFPSTYTTIAKYFGERGVGWDEVNPKDVLGSPYSSAAGFGQILAEVDPIQPGGGGSCSV